MGKSYKKQTSWISHHPQFDFKEKRSRSIRNRNNSKDIEDFTDKSRSFKYDHKMIKNSKKYKQNNILINTNKFNNYKKIGRAHV